MVFLFVLSEHFRCRTRSGPHTVGWRFCAVQAFCRRQNLGAGAIHLPRAFKRSQDSIKITTPDGVVIFMEATPRFELGVELLQSSALPLGYVALWIKGRNDLPFIVFGAGDEARTRYLHLGKVALYQMSYTCMSWSILCRPHTHETRNFRGTFRRICQAYSPEGWCLRPESNQRHGDFQSPALPTELQRQMATRKGLEPSTSGVTGRRSNQLNYRAIR